MQDEQSKLSDTAQTVVGSDGLYYRPSDLLRGGAETPMGFARPEPKTPRERLLDGDDVLVPLIKGPFGEGKRDCDEGHSFFLLAANTYKTDLEREIQMLFEIGVPFNEETCPDVFDDAFVIEVFAFCKDVEGILRRVAGKVRLSAHDGNVSSVEKKLSLILNIRQGVPGIRGWVRIDPDPKRSKR